jgi:hypothetical protein
MDEMTRVRDLRADAPHPDRSRLAPGRQELMKAARRDGRLRLPRLRWQLAAVGAVAVLTATALLGSQLWGGGGATTGARPPEITPLAGGARGVLEDAASVVAQGHAPVPHEGQWIYEVEDQIEYQQNLPLKETEHWTRFDNGGESDRPSPREAYQFLAAPPHDLDAVKAKARSFNPPAWSGEPRAEHDLRALELLAQSYPAPPQGLAAVYRAMATIPHLKAVETRDALGRKAIALYLDPDSREKKEGAYDWFLLDATTYAYAGDLGVSLDSNGTQHFGNPHVKKGDVFESTARRKIALVGEKGGRP